MSTNELSTRLDELAKKIEKAKEKIDFEERFHDGHKQSLAEIEKHYRDISDKLDSELHSYEEKVGHINTLEEQIILLLGSVE